MFSKVVTGRGEGGCPARVMELLEAIDDLPDDATGALVFDRDDRRYGAVLVEAGRICWAIAGNMHRRLTDLLLEEMPNGLDPAGLKSFYKRCQARGEPLGQTLVAEGHLTPEAFRSVLCQHTAEALLRLGEGSFGVRRWHSHSRNQYEAKYTFPPAEILGAIGAQCEP
ncbi:MAG: hypothetical protein OEY14_17600, partial [Myxococcales bacterium]|nr:hypothetical protein [Myxococcales bacterium]